MYMIDPYEGRRPYLGRSEPRRPCVHCGAPSDCVIKREPRCEAHRCPTWHWFEIHCPCCDASSVIDCSKTEFPTIALRCHVCGFGAMLLGNKAELAPPPQVALPPLPPLYGYVGVRRMR